jgi:hypothetical protein
VGSFAWPAGRSRSGSQVGERSDLQHGRKCTFCQRRPFATRERRSNLVLPGSFADTAGTSAVDLVGIDRIERSVATDQPAGGSG